MKRASVFLCGILAAALLAGCGSAMPDLTQEETDIISEYAVGVLLKYDKHHSGRLVDTSAYETTEETTEEAEETPEEEQTDTAESTEPAAGTEAEPEEIEEAETASATIEGYYGIPDFTFQYTGYDLTQSYPDGDFDGAEGEAMFFSMDATPGTQLLVLHFTATNTSPADQTLDMLGYGAKFRVSVNGGRGESALTTMLLDDMETYRGPVPAGGSVELVSIVEVPQGTSVETIDFTLRGGEGNAVMKLQ